MQPLDVALIWHMHQPDYRDPVSGRTLLPWTCLHAVKDYGEMVKTAAAVPGARMTFNLAPILLEQIERYLRGEAMDSWLEAARRDPAEMSVEDREFLLRQFFSVHADRHILPHRRYRELAGRRGSGQAVQVGDFSEQDLRDLQVWFLLAWSGHHLRREEPIAHLLKKGEYFSEREKAALLQSYQREMAATTDRYRQMEAAGEIEISVTPYAHPILPLLCDTDIAAQSTPGVRLPKTPFRLPDDARLHVRLGLEMVAERLGERPRGMWPAEGAVSEAALRLLREEGVLWAASDEEILARSRPDGLSDRRHLYRPYTFAGLPLLFRDRHLSDRIGFVYAHWEPERAAADLIAQLKNVALIAPGGVIALILDGENCWERYADNGYPFLIALYRGILAEPALRMATVSGALAGRPAQPLPRLAPGSWINANFNIWIGHPEENTAWEWLARARREAVTDGEMETATGTAVPEKIRHLLRAQGSDWFWWFGDDHVTAQADIFDRLFRRHLEALYRAAGLPTPFDLHNSIKRPHRLAQVREPTALFTPRIDGRISDYFEWLAAGYVDLSPGGAMHAAHAEFSVLLYGYDRENLYLRLDPEEDLPSLMGVEGRLEIRLAAEDDWIVRLQPEAGGLFLSRPGKSTAAVKCTAACGRIIEMAVPLATLGLSPGDRLRISIHLLRAAGEIARWPAEGPVDLPYRGEYLEKDDWRL
ncbi:MAG: glycoside hydrolase family 57 protein [Desulfuromonadales bacterium]